MKTPGAGEGFSAEGGRRYELIEQVGEGGFGEVYRGRMVGSSGFVKQVGIKLLNTETVGSAEFAGRLRDEAKQVGALCVDFAHAAPANVARSPAASGTQQAKQRVLREEQHYQNV